MSSNQNRVPRITRLLDSGLSPSVVARRCRCSTRWVNWLINNRGLPSNRPLNPSQLDALVTLRDTYSAPVSLLASLSSTAPSLLQKSITQHRRARTRAD